MGMTKLTRILGALALAIVTSGVALAGQAEIASASSKIDYETHSPPTFTLDVRPPVGYDVQLFLHNPRAYESRLARATVSWGDGITVTKQLDPLLLYTKIGFSHRYDGKPDRTIYKVTVRLYDTDNIFREALDYAWIYPLYTMILNPVRFYAVDDCDFWFGKGDFEVWYRFEGNHDGNTGGHVAADLDSGESVQLFTLSKIFRNAETWDHPIFAFTWRENDGLTVPPPSFRRIDLWPALGTVTREYNDSQNGCDVRLRYTVTTLLVQ
jgi:hypothetical protein